MASAIGRRSRAKAKAWLDATPRDTGFGNLFEHAVGLQAGRLASVESPTDEELLTLEADDFLAPGETL